MDTPGSAPDVPQEDALSVFTRSGHPCTPRTAAEVADELDCPPPVAEKALEELTERGALRSKRIDGQIRVWWATVADRTDESLARGGSELGQFGAFVDAVEDYAIFMLDPDGYVDSWNDGAERIKGYTEGEIVGEHFSTFYPEEDVDSGVPGGNLETAAAEGRVEDQGWRVRKDGSRFWADVVITAIRDDGGTLQGFTKVTRDLTERREYEQRLRHERDVTERILETVPVSITVMTPDGEFLRANSRALERLGIDENDLGRYTPRSWAIFDEEGERLSFEETPLSAVAETGEPVYDYQCQVDLPEIGRRWLSINAAPIEQDGNTDDRVVISVDDVTERKERERELRRERNQTEELLRTAPIAIAVQNASGETLLANRRAQEVLGLSEQEIIDEPEDIDEWEIYDADGAVIDPEDTPSARVRASGEPVFEREIAIERPDGERKWLSINATPVFGPDGDLDRIITAGEDITQLKRRERQLERRKNELETELSEILGRISDAFYALDEEWRFTHVNERAEELLQRSREELLGESLWDVFPEATGTIIRDRFREAMDTQEPVSFEIEHEDLDIWVGVNAYPSETGLSVYFQDVTERKEREQELERYRTIVETVNDGIYTVDPDGYFTMVNEAYAEMTGYPCEELVGSHVSLIVDDEIIENARRTEEELLAGERETVIAEADMKRADGGTVPAEATFAIFPTGDGGYERIAVVRDITERREQARALEESERRYRTLAEHFPNGAVALFDEDLRYTAAGGQLLEAEGVDPEDRVGRSISELYPDELVEEITPYFRAALEGEANSFEAEYAGRNLFNQTLPVRNADDEVYAGMLVVQDVTERREYERKLEESNERLEQFAYAASHDLQEPLRMVSSYLQLIEQRYGDVLDEDGEEFIGFAVDGAERMREMINGLLKYSRVETQGQPFGPVDLDGVLEDVREDLQVAIEESDALITADPLPRVEGDEGQLRQVFQNLLSNAIEYSGDASPRVHASAERNGPEWIVSVRDEGIGIDPAHQDRIFEVFKRLHDSDDRSGTGIGLALCERIVERHGGRIRVESERGEGATFYFTLPHADQDTEKTGPDPSLR